jgi:hypothetical protein
MLQPATGSMTCSVCNASYESDAKLREHQTMAHRGTGAEERPKESASIAPSQVPQD